MKILEEDPPLAEECKLPWLLNAFLYPFSASGLLHIATFVFLPRLVRLFTGWMAIFLSPYLREGTAYIITLLIIPFYITFYSYVNYYIAYRITDSSKGSRRAIEAPIFDTFSISDFVSEVVLLLACVAICLLAPVGYYIVTRRTDLWFYVLLCCGGYFLPMALLKGVLFESFDALNPIEIILSIGRTLFSYVGLVIFFFMLCGLMIVIVSMLPIWRFVIEIIVYYLVFVVAHRVGWFYWWHKDRLDWGL